MTTVAFLQSFRLALRLAWDVRADADSDGRRCPKRTPMLDMHKMQLLLHWYTRDVILSMVMTTTAIAVKTAARSRIYQTSISWPCLTQQKIRNPGSEAPLLESHHMGLELGILGTRRSSRASSSCKSSLVILIRLRETFLHNA